MRIYNKKDEYKTLRIKPEGWMNELIIEPGFSSCGQAKYGIHIQLSSEKGGGVLTNDDLIAISERIKEHFKELAEHIDDKSKQ